MSSAKARFLTAMRDACASDAMIDGAEQGWRAAVKHAATQSDQVPNGTRRDIEPFSLEWAFKVLTDEAVSAQDKRVRRYGHGHDDPHVRRAVEMVRAHVKEMR